mgnify:CR=1 FL=1
MAQRCGPKVTVRNPDGNFEDIDFDEFLLDSDLGEFVFDNPDLDGFEGGVFIEELEDGSFDFKTKNPDGTDNILGGGIFDREGDVNVEFGGGGDPDDFEFKVKNQDGTETTLGKEDFVLSEDLFAGTENVDDGQGGTNRSLNMSTGGSPNQLPTLDKANFMRDGEVWQEKSRTTEQVVVTSDDGNASITIDRMTEVEFELEGTGAGAGTTAPPKKKMTLKFNNP